jgi:uncharacterized protein (TIGR02118 family)
MVWHASSMMIISVLYPVGSDDTFDMDYYMSSHVPLVQRLLEPMGMRQTRVMKADSDAAFPVVAELDFDDLDSLNAALAAHGPETQADIPNFTNVTPVIQISERIL